MLVEQMPLMDEESRKRLEELFGEPTAFDASKMLFDSFPEMFDATPVRKIARESGKITRVEMHAPGEIAEVGGRKYQVQESGAWKRIS